ncbi:hypothetical protein FOZ61_001153 [Perkinsus olseni]|uniref:Uncharacterized protein n=1 Tax=Perkinsus olseni TaxID=32597 RepID=A0A7J6KQL0_PEROL|nr:hypothetical protein FOZ61_001153 [Perkinsus olseni]
MKLLSAWAALLIEWSEASTLSAVVADHTTYNRSKGSLPGPRQHACCYFDSVWSENDTLVMKAEEAGTGTLYVTHPHPLNHTSSVLIGCTILGLGSSNPECKRCKEYAVCQYCQCIAGMFFWKIFVQPLDTMPTGSHPPLIQKFSTLIFTHFAQRAAKVYSPETNTMGMCPFNYEMYPFGRSPRCGSSGMPLAMLIAVTIVSSVMLGDHHEILEKDEHSGWVVLDGTLSDPSVSLWSEITYHRDKLYLRDIRYVDYQFHPRDLSVWEVDPVTCERVLEIKTESEVTCFDVFSRDENLLVAYISPIHPAELRVDYHSLSQADCSKRRLMDEYIARCFHVPMYTEAVRFLREDLICVGHSDGCQLGITLVDVALDGPGEMLSTANLDCNPGDFISSIEISPCGHIAYLGVRSPSKEPSPGREVAVAY